MKSITLEDLHIARERAEHKKALKKAKQEWRDSLTCSKKSYYNQLFLKLTADGLYINKECEQFTNREIDYTITNRK